MTPQITLAEGVAGAEEAFVMRMKQARVGAWPHKIELRQSLGAGRTGPEGDAARHGHLAAYVIKTYPDYYRYFGEKEFTWNKIKQPNRNPLLTMSIGADGLKTGNIDEKSGFGIVASAVEEGRRLILAAYGARHGQGACRRGAQAAAMGLPQLRGKGAVKAGEVVGSAQVYGGAKGSVSLAAEGDVTALLQRGGSEKLSAGLSMRGR